MKSGSGTTLRGAPGEAGRSCPDQAALDFLTRYDGAIKWCINAHSIPAHQRADVRQEVSLRIIQRFRKHGPLQPEPDGGQHLGYAVMVTRNCCIRAIRQRQAKPSATISESADLRVASDERQPDAQLERRQAHERLHMAVASLPPLARAVMQQMLLGLSIKEVADHFEISPGNAKVIVHRARQLLRKRLVHP